jgi:hypothetical protein
VNNDFHGKGIGKILQINCLAKKRTTYNDWVIDAENQSSITFHENLDSQPGIIKDSG